MRKLLAWPQTISNCGFGSLTTGRFDYAHREHTTMEMIVLLRVGMAANSWEIGRYFMQANDSTCLGNVAAKIALHRLRASRSGKLTASCDRTPGREPGAVLGARGGGGLEKSIRKEAKKVKPAALVRE